MRTKMGRKVCWLWVICLCVLASPVFGLDVSPSSGSGQAGEMVTISIDLSGNKEGINAFGMDLTFDAEKLEHVESKETDLTMGFQFFAWHLNSPGNLVRIGWARLMELSEEGSVVAVTFRIKPEATGTASLSLSKFVDGFAEATTTAGSITIQ